MSWLTSDLPTLRSVCSDPDSWSGNKHKGENIAKISPSIQCYYSSDTSALEDATSRTAALPLQIITLPAKFTASRKGENNIASRSNKKYLLHSKQACRKSNHRITLQGLNISHGLTKGLEKSHRCSVDNSCYT